MKIIQKFLTKNPCYKAGRKIVVKGLMLHSVGCPQPNALSFINVWNEASYKRACVHGFIDGISGIVYQTLPWDHRGWHGGGTSNNTHIGIEVCEPSCIKYTKGSSFTCTDFNMAKESVKMTYKASVELFAYLCKLYNLNPLAKGVIVSHSEGHKLGIASNHGDIEHLWRGLGLRYTMDGFRQDVKAAMSSGVVESVDDEYTVHVTTTASSIKVGDLVKVKAGAKTYEGKSLASFTYTRTHQVKSISGQRAVITFDGVVIAGMNLNDLELVNSAGTDKNTPIKIGDKVKINKGATTYVGGSLSSFVYDRVHEVKSIKDDRVVVTYNGIVIAAVNKKDLTVV